MASKRVPAERLRELSMEVMGAAEDLQGDHELLRIFRELADISASLLTEADKRTPDPAPKGGE